VDNRVETYAELAARIMRRPPRLGHTRLVAVDGPSGSGKTTFADSLARAVRAAGATVAVMHTDALLDGWQDPLSIWPVLDDWVLDRIARGENGRHPVYDWLRARYGDEWHTIPVSEVLILEGTTAAAARNRARASYAVFVTADRAIRTRRALRRDGGQIAGPLRAWQEAEDRYFITESTEASVDLVVDGAADLGHDPGSAYVRAG
jgi:uridine kinase